MTLFLSGTNHVFPLLSTWSHQRLRAFHSRRWTIGVRQFAGGLYGDQWNHVSGSLIRPAPAACLDPRPIIPLFDIPFWDGRCRHGASHQIETHGASHQIKTLAWRTLHHVGVNKNSWLGLFKDRFALEVKVMLTEWPSAKDLCLAGIVSREGKTTCCGLTEHCHSGFLEGESQ